jgi:ABC-type uncharacterized transport system substrate-binding protein
MNVVARILAGLGLLLALGQGVQAGQGQVALVLSDTAGAYQEVFDATRHHLARLDPGVIVTAVDAGKIEREGVSALAGHDLVVSVGVRATQVARARTGSVPLLATLVPRAAFERLRQGYQGTEGFSAIYLDQPLARMMHLARLIQPDVRHVLALLGPDSQALGGELPAQAQKLGLNLVVERVNAPHELQPALQRMMSPDSGHLFLGLPDHLVYAANSLQTILLATYRHNVPFLGFSAAQVRAGAVAAAYSTPEQIGQQLAEVIARNAASRRWTLPPPRAPKYFSVAFNAQVGRSLGLPVQSEAGLAERLRKLED